jgi:ribokinase
MGKVIVVGSINMDVVVRTKRQPRPGETVLGSELLFIPGGKGSNQAVAAARLQAETCFIGKVGIDAFGDTLRAFLSEEPIATTLVSTTDSVSTGTALITVGDDGENAIVVVPGANNEISAKDLEGIDFHKDDLVLAQLEIPVDTVLALFKAAKRFGATTMLNTAPALDVPTRLFDLVDYLVVNETELAHYSNFEPIPQTDEEILKALRELALNEQTTVVVTRGSKGVLAKSCEIYNLEALNVPAIDTTGAGDCFVGGLAAGLSGGLSLGDALEFGNAAAAVSVQRVGASASLPTLSEVESIMQLNPRKGR